MKDIKPKTLRTLVILAVMIIIGIGYFTHVGVGNLSALGLGSVHAICPLGALEAMIAEKTFIPRALIGLLVVVLAIVIIGRVFCAWICPVPLLQKILPSKRKKDKETEREINAAQKTHLENLEDAQSKNASTPLNDTPTNSKEAKKGKKVKFDSRHGILLGALVTTGIFGFPVFCLICPIGLTFATLLLVMRLFGFGEVTWTLIVFPLILIAELLLLKKWCHKICPLGALISLVSGANKTLKPEIDDSKCLNTTKGHNCTICYRSCPENIDIRRLDSTPRQLTECTKCLECSHNCPVQAIKFPLLPSKQKTDQENTAVAESKE